LEATQLIRFDDIVVLMVIVMSALPPVCVKMDGWAMHVKNEISPQP